MRFLYFFLFVFFWGQAQKGIVNNLKPKEGFTQKQLDIVYAYAKNFPENTEIAFGILNNGSPIYYGVKRIGSRVETIENRDHVFEIGSITKVFTATLLADMVVNDSLNFNAPIETYLDFSLKNDPQISFKQLANHTSGLPNMPSNIESYNAVNPEKNYGRSQLKFYLSKKLKRVKSTNQINYSNLGYALLGYTLGKIKAKSYEELLSENIASKYDMTSTTTNFNTISSTYVQGYDIYGRPMPHWELNALVGAGGVMSTTQDLLKFAMAQCDPTNEVLAKTRQITTRAPNGTIGLGWFVKSNYRKKMYTHRGKVGGFTSYIGVDVVNQDAVVVLVNLHIPKESMFIINNLSSTLFKTLN